VIPYQIDPAFNATMRGRIDTAVNWINDRTDLLLIQRTDERDFVGVRSVERGCSAAVGRQGNEQPLSLANNCGVGNIAHEFLHAAGMWHELSTPGENGTLSPGENGTLSRGVTSPVSSSVQLFL
jgi:hypothetical protein